MNRAVERSPNRRDHSKSLKCLDLHAFFCVLLGSPAPRDSRALERSLRGQEPMRGSPGQSLRVLTNAAPLKPRERAVPGRERESSPRSNERGSTEAAQPVTGCHRFGCCFPSSHERCSIPTSPRSPVLRIEFRCRQGTVSRGRIGRSGFRRGSSRGRRRKLLRWSHDGTESTVRTICRRSRSRFAIPSCVPSWICRVNFCMEGVP